MGAAFQVRYYFVCVRLRSAEDIAENASRSAARVAVSVAPVSVAGILSIPLVIATQESLTECLRRSVPVVVRSLRVEALPALGIIGARVQSSLISLVHRNLGPIVIATIAAVVTVATVVTITTVVVVASVAAIVAVITVIIADPTALIPVAPPIAISILVSDPVTITTLVLCFSIISIASILRLHRRTGRYPENKCETQNRPANPDAENILHISPLSLSRR